MNNLIVNIIILIFSCNVDADKEYISIIHVGPVDKPIYPTIISKNNIGDTISVKNYLGKQENYYDCRNYIIDSNLYSKLEKFIINYKPNNNEKRGVDDDFIVYIRGCKTHTFYLEYRETESFFHQLILKSKDNDNGAEVANRLENVFDNYSYGR